MVNPHLNPFMQLNETQNNQAPAQQVAAPVVDKNKEPTRLPSMSDISKI